MSLTICTPPPPPQCLLICFCPPAAPPPFPFSLSPPYPVCLSPMISSRWPLPMGTKLSTALIPVCMGSFTEMRGMIPGAFTPTRARRSVAIGPWDKTNDEDHIHHTLTAMDDGSEAVGTSFKKCTRIFRCVLNGVSATATVCVYCTVSNKHMSNILLAPFTWMTYYESTF